MKAGSCCIEDSYEILVLVLVAKPLLAKLYRQLCLLILSLTSKAHGLRVGWRTPFKASIFQPQWLSSMNLLFSSLFIIINRFQAMFDVCMILSFCHFYILVSSTITGLRHSSVFDSKTASVENTCDSYLNYLGQNSYRHNHLVLLY
jgi:hypothetical protein